jgi:hypothetical protein
VKRYTTKIQATPSWLTAEQLEEIESIYLEAKRLEQLDGIKRHVGSHRPTQGKERERFTCSLESTNSNCKREYYKKQ